MGLQRKTGAGLKPRCGSHTRGRGSRGGHTVDGAGSLNHRLLLLSLRYGTPDWAEGEGRTVCVCGYSKGL